MKIRTDGLRLPRRGRAEPLWRLVPLAIAVILVTSPAARPAAEGSFERTLKVTGPVQLEVQTGSGHINVRRGESSTVHVTATIRANSGWRLSDNEAERKVRYLEANPPIQQNGNMIRIGHIEDRELTRNVSISYDLEVPAETELHSETGSGSQSVEGIRGPLRASTGSGSLHVQDIGDEVEAQTGSGDIRIHSVKGRVRAHTGSGSIHALGVNGGCDASTGSGDIQLEQTGRGDDRAETGSGSIDLRGVRGSLRARTGSGGIQVEGEPAGDWSVHTGSGTITVRLSSQAGFDLDAHTSSGHVETARAVTVQGTISRGQLRGRVGGGGPRLELRTASGNINID